MEGAISVKNMNIENHKLRIRGHPREWFVHPEVLVSVQALKKLKIKPAAAWKYICSWKSFTPENVYSLSYDDLMELLAEETERTEKERDARRKDPSKMVFYSSFYVYTRTGGPGNDLKFAFHFTREAYRKNRAAKLKLRRSLKQKPKQDPHLVYVRKNTQSFDREAYLQKVREMNAEIRENVREETPLEKAAERWKQIIYQDNYHIVSVPTLVYSKPKKAKMSFEKDLRLTVEKNKEDAEKRKWKPPPEGYQIGASNSYTKERLCALFAEWNYGDISAEFLKAEEKSIQTDIPAALVLRLFEATAFDNSLVFNIYRRDHSGYPDVKYCFPRSEKTNEFSKEAKLMVFQRV